MLAWGTTELALRTCFEIRFLAESRANSSPRKACEAGESTRFVDTAQRSRGKILAALAAKWNFKTRSKVTICWLTVMQSLPTGRIGQIGSPPEYQRLVSQGAKEVGPITKNTPHVRYFDEKYAKIRLFMTRNGPLRAYIGRRFVIRLGGESERDANG